MSAEPLPVNSVVGDFVIDQLLGHGGFGITYRCHHRYTHSNDVIKEFFPDYLVKRGMTGQVVPKDKSREKEVDFQEGLERFLREAISLQKLTWPNSHPNIIQIKHFFNANNTAYFVMPFVDGKPLDDVAREKFWSEFELATMLSEILSGLTYVHQAGLIHRDIKPGNMYIQNNGKPILLDFGAAIKSETGGRGKTIIATRDYAPHEQYDEQNGNQGPWTDIYALGASFYEIVTGRPPPEALKRVAGIATLPAAADVAKNRFNADFLETIDTALRIKPEDRFQSAQQWQKALEPVFTRAKNSVVLGIFSTINKNVSKRTSVKLNRLLAAINMVRYTQPARQKILDHLRTFGMTADLAPPPKNKEDNVKISLLKDQSKPSPTSNTHDKPVDIALAHAAVTRINAFFQKRGVTHPGSDEKGYWCVNKQSVNGYISIDEEGDDPTVLVQIPILALGSPPDVDLMELVLKINAGIDGPPRFSIDEKWLVVIARAPVRFLQDDTELATLIDQAFDIVIQFGQYLETIENQRTQLDRQKQTRLDKEPDARSDAESSAIVALLRLALREAAIADIARFRTVSVNAVGEPLLADSEELRAGFIDFSNQQETQASLKPGQWLDLPFERLGIVSRITEQAVLDTDQETTLSRHKRGFSFFSLQPEIDGQPFSFFMQEQLETLKPGTNNNNLFTWFQVFMEHNKESRLAFISSYEPSKAIREIAARNHVTLVHYPIDKLPQALLHTAAEFSMPLVNDNPVTPEWLQKAEIVEEAVREPDSATPVPATPKVTPPEINQNHLVWNEERFFARAASKIDQIQLDAIRKVHDVCKLDGFNIIWGKGAEHGSFSVREQSIIKSRSLFTVYTGGWLTLSLAGLHGTPAAEKVRDELYTAISGAHLLEIPSSYASKSPGYDVKIWTPVAEPLIQIIFDVVRKYETPQINTNPVRLLPARWREVCNPYSPIESRPVKDLPDATIILEVGAEGGSLSVIGAPQSDANWQFWCILDDQTPTFIDEDPIHRESNAVKSWGDLIALLDKEFPYWVSLYPLYVHPDFRKQLAELIGHRLMIKQQTRDNVRKN